MYKFTSINQEYPLSTLDENQVDKIMFVSAIMKSSQYVDVHEV